MGAKAGRVRWLILIQLGLAALLLFASCRASGGMVSPPAAGLAPSITLDWPPAAVAVRQASDTEITLLGRDWSLKGGRAYTEGTALLLRGGQELPWGLYSIGYLSANNELQSLTADYSTAPLQVGDGTRLYVGLANYRNECWDWYSAGGTLWHFTYQRPQDYRSVEGQAFFAFVLAGPGQAQLNQLTIEVSGTVVPAPQHLSADSPEVGVVALDWDAVPLADGYNVYRAGEHAWEAAQKVNAEPVTVNSYEDTGMPLGRLYWYYVTAVAHNESGPSNSALVWTHQIELPAPQNAHVSARGETSFTAAWDWEMANPGDGFVIFIATWPDFPIEYDTERWPMGGFARECEISERIPGYIYYWKMCARQGGKYGRLTDELTGSTKGSWTWGDVEVIDTGWPPVRAIDADGKLAVAYIKDNSVTLATDQGDHWRIDVPLPHGPQVITGSETYGEYLDVAFNDGLFLVAGEDACAGDAWAAYGQQYDWHRQCIHGDGQSVGMNPKSGLYIETAMSDDEMAVVHLDLTGEDDADPDDAQLLVHRKPVSGGSWNTERIRYFNVEVLPSHSACYHDGQLHVLTTDLFSSELYTCDSEGHWVLVDVTPPGQSGLVKHHDLHWFQGEWYTPGFHYSQQELFLLTGVEPPWSDRRITVPGYDMGHEARLAVEGNEAVMIFYGYNFGHARYQFAVYSEDWQYHPIGVPHVAAENYANGADIVLMDGSPYFVFWDEGTEEIKVAKGTPPAD
jgi:hypothetical protein